MYSENNGISCIRRDDGSHAGMAVLVDSQHVLTCAHVVNIACGKDDFESQQPPAAQEFRVDLLFPDLIELTGRVVKWGLAEKDGPDLAVLKLSREQSEDVPCARFSQSPATGMPWKVFGQHSGEGEPHWTSDRGSSVSSPVLSGSGSTTRDERIQLNGVGGAGRWIDHGDSGAAVWCPQLAAAIGIAATRHRNAAVNRISGMISVDAVRSFWPVEFRARQIRRVFDRLMDDHPYFAGRNEIVDEIEDLLTGRPGGYIVIEAGSGFGKSALMVHLATRLGLRTAYHFFTRDYDFGDGYSDRGLCLASLHEQLAEFFGEPTANAATDADRQVEIQELLGRSVPQGRAIVVVIDAADEAEFSLQPLLGKLGTGVHVIISARSMAGRNWFEELPPNGEPSTRISLDSFDHGGTQDLLIAGAGEAGPALSEDMDFVNDLLRLTRGDPFFLALLMDDFRDCSEQQARQLLIDIEASSGKGLDPGHAGLNAYLDRWWKRAALKLEDPATQSLVSWLAAARAPLNRTDLISIAPNSPLNAFSVDSVLDRLRRFLIGDDGRGYLFNHERFKLHVRRKLGTAVLKRAEQTLTEYAMAYDSRPDSENNYAYAALTPHLCDAVSDQADPSTIVNLLCHGRFLERKATAFSRIQSGLEDIGAALRLVQSLFDQNLDHPDRLGRLNEHALCLMIAEERLLEKIEELAEDGGLLKLALSGHVDAAIAEALTLSKSRDRVIQLSLIAEATSQSPETHQFTRKALEQILQTVENSYTPLSNREEGTFADFASIAPLTLRKVVRSCGARLVRDQNEMDFVILLQDALTGQEYVAGDFPDVSDVVTYIASLLKYGANPTSMLQSCVEVSQDFRDALLELHSLDATQTVPESLLVKLRTSWQTFIRTPDSDSNTYERLHQRLLNPADDTAASLASAAKSSRLSISVAARDVVRLRILAEIAESDLPAADSIASEIRYPLLRGIGLTYIIRARRQAGMEYSSLLNEAIQQLKDRNYPAHQPWKWGGDLLTYLPPALIRLGDDLDDGTLTGIVSSHWPWNETEFHLTVIRVLREQPHRVRSSTLKASFQWALDEVKYRSREGSTKGWEALIEGLKALKDVSADQFLNLLETLHSRGHLNRHGFYSEAAAALAPHFRGDQIQRFTDVMEYLEDPWHELAWRAALQKCEGDLTVPAFPSLAEQHPDGLFHSHIISSNKFSSSMIIAECCRQRESDRQFWLTSVSEIISHLVGDESSDSVASSLTRFAEYAVALQSSEIRDRALSCLRPCLENILANGIEILPCAIYAQKVARTESPLAPQLVLLLALCARSIRLQLSRYQASRNRFAQACAALVDLHLTAGGTAEALRLEQALARIQV